MPIEYKKMPELGFDNMMDEWNYQVLLYGEEMDVGGGTITKEEIDVIGEHPRWKRISIAANYPDLEGVSLRPFRLYNEKMGVICGKHKPSIKDANSESDKQRIEKASRNFDMLKKKYRGISFTEILNIIKNT